MESINIVGRRISGLRKQTKSRAKGGRSVVRLVRFLFPLSGNWLVQELAAPKVAKNLEAMFSLCSSNGRFVSRLDGLLNMKSYPSGKAGKATAGKTSFNGGLSSRLIHNSIKLQFLSLPVRKRPIDISNSDVLLRLYRVRVFIYFRMNVKIISMIGEHRFRSF